MPSYTDLQTYRKCPRLYGFGLLGYKMVEIPAAMLTGQLVHTVIAAHFKGQDISKAVAEALGDNLEALNGMADADKRYKAIKATYTAAKRATDLYSRYIPQWAQDYTECQAETEIKSGSVVCHPDLIAYYDWKRVIVDYKTSKSPDMRWYDVSGQLDLYAWVLQYQQAPVELIIYDVISDEGIYRHTRPPRTELGQDLYFWVDRLKHLRYQGCLDEPHLTWDCPQRCAFWEPCWLAETGTWSDCEDYLGQNYLKEGDKNEAE